MPTTTISRCGGTPAGPTFAQAVATLALTRDLRGYWRLGELASPWLDTSGNSAGPVNMTRRIGGGVAISHITGALPAAQDDGAIQLNNPNTLTGDWLEGTDINPFRFNFGSGDADMTLAAWVRPLANVNAYRGFVLSQMRSIPAAGWALFVTWPGLRIGFSRRGASTSDFDGPALAASQWTFIVATYDSVNGHRIYANAVLVATDASLFTGLPTFNQGPLIGPAPSTDFASWKLFYGGVDEASIWGGALTATEIATLYAAA